MKRLFCLLILLLLLIQSAAADVPPGVWGRALTDEEMHSLMQAAMTEAGIAADVCVSGGGTLLAVYEFGDGFCVARRSDGLLMLCCFIADGDALRLVWHNDLLLSSAQPLTLTVNGPSWGDAPLPALCLQYMDVLSLTLPLTDNAQLELRADSGPEGWRVTGMTLLVSRGDGRYSPALFLPEDALSQDIFLSSCYPQDWSASR